VRVSPKEALALPEAHLVVLLQKQVLFLTQDRAARRLQAFVRGRRQWLQVGRVSSALREQAASRIQRAFRSRRQEHAQRRIRGLGEQVDRVRLIQRVWRQFKRGESSQLRRRQAQMQTHFRYFDDMKRKLQEDSQIRIAHRFRRIKKQGLLGNKQTKQEQVGFITLVPE